MSIGNHTLPSQIMTKCNDGLMYCFSEWANEVSQGAFWLMALIAFGVVVFMATIRFGTHRAFGFAGFVIMVGSIYLSVLQFLAWWVASVFILIGVVGIASMFLRDSL